MILALVLAAALSGQAPVVLPAQPEASAPAVADTPVQSPQDRMDALQQVYDSSCGSRGYGAYDDVCNSIREQIHAADKELTWEIRHPHKAAAKPAATEVAPTTAPPAPPKS